MNYHIFRSIQEPLRKDPSFEERWNGQDNGLITCWEVGRLKRVESPELAELADNGELPVLGWKGGVKKEFKQKEKFGSLRYLALWQGLRGNDLDIDLSKETTIICSKTRVKVIFTPNIEKFSEP